MVRFLLLLSLLLVACESSQTPANAGAECASDAKCALGAWTADCCPRCKPFGATYSEVAAMEERCTAMPPVSGRCPALECAPHEGPDFIAKCVSGRCIVGP